MIAVHGTALRNPICSTSQSTRRLTWFSMSAAGVFCCMRKLCTQSYHVGFSPREKPNLSP